LEAAAVLCADAPPPEADYGDLSAFGKATTTTRATTVMVLIAASAASPRLELSPIANQQHGEEA
jgi:hypothetical protein